jgi:inorganic triphosphatase YgiF
MQLALTMKQEIEIKLLATPAALERLEASPWFGRRAKDASQQELISVYFDTPGLELREAGVTLRVRHVGTKRLQTIKSSLGALARVEAEQEIEGDAPDLGCVRAAALRPLGRKKKLARQLSPVFETCVTRTQFPLELPGGAVEVAIDRGEIRAGRSVEAISELEVELKAGSLGAAVELAKRLSQQFELHYGVRSKAERGYALFERASVAAVRAERIELEPGVSVAGGFRDIGLACLRQFALNEPAFERGDSEGIHQMRVALRRLRAAISLFRDGLGDPETEDIRAQLRWLTNQLGPLRDHDVFTEESVLAIADAKAQHASELQSLQAALREARAKKLAHAQAALSSERARKVVLDTALWLMGGSWASARNESLRSWREQPLERLVKRVLPRRVKKVGRKLRKLEELDPEARHKLRIAVKKLHYGSEFFASLFPARKPERKHFVKVLKELQTSLGGLNDLRIHDAIARELLHAQSDGRSDEREGAFGIGLVLGTEQARTQGYLRVASRASKKLERATRYWR